MSEVYPACIFLSRALFWIDAVERIRVAHKVPWRYAVVELYGLLYRGRILFAWHCESVDGFTYPASSLDCWQDVTRRVLINMAAEHYRNGEAPPLPVADHDCWLFVEEGHIDAYLNGTLPMVLPPPVKAEPWRGTVLPAADSGRVVVRMLRRVVMQVPAEQPKEPEPAPVQQIASAPALHGEMVEDSARHPLLPIRAKTKKQALLLALLKHDYPAEEAARWEQRTDTAIVEAFKLRYGGQGHTITTTVVRNLLQRFGTRIRKQRQAPKVPR